MSGPVELRGVAWEHTRATGPLHVTAQAYADLQPQVRIRWDTRSLWAFGEASLDELAVAYDLVVLDHPMIGYAAERELIVALDDHVGEEWLAAQAANAVGRSHASYRYRGRQWAAAIDAACPVAVSRPDLLDDLGVAVPETWDEVIALARTTGRVAVPLKRIDALSLFLTLCANQGDGPLDLARESAVAADVGERALAQLIELRDLVDPACLDRNPIDILGAMCGSDEIVYCPHAYGYTNYSRRGYAPRRVRFHDFAGPQAPHVAGTTLGGAGLAVSSHSRHVASAVAYLAWIAGAECQRTTYVLAGGQPGNAAAWEDDIANAVTDDFFRRTRRTIEHAYLRPNHPGMHDFQAEAGAAVRSYLLGERGPGDTLAVVDDAFRRSRPDAANGS